MEKIPFASVIMLLNERVYKMIFNNGLPDFQNIIVNYLKERLDVLSFGCNKLKLFVYPCSRPGYEYVHRNGYDKNTHRFLAG